jgi:hypothetical protein
MSPLFARSWFLVGCLIAAALLAAAPARARGEQTEVQVLDVASPDAFENAKALSVALDRAVSRSDRWKLAPGDYSLEVLTAALDCDDPPDADCLQRIGAEIRSERYIWGVLHRSGGEVVGELHLWDRGTDAAKTELRYSANLDDAAEDALFQVAERALRDLLGSVGGRVLVIAGEGEGEVVIDGEPRGHLANGRLELELPAGEHEILIHAPGYRDARGRVTVRSGERAELRLDVFSDAEPVAVAEPPREQHRPNTQRVVGFSLIALGSAAAIAGGVFTGLSAVQQDDQEFADYRGTVPVGGDVCEVAEERGDDEIVDKCDANLFTRRMAYILTPTGLVLAGAGIAMVATAHPRESKSASRPRATAQVGIGPRGGQLRVSVPF